MAHYRGLWSHVKADGPYMCQTWFSSPWLTQTQANKLKGLCFAHFLRNLLYVHKRKGKCHWLLLPHHGMEYNKKKEFIALFLEWKISGILSASPFVHLRDRTLFNHIHSVFPVDSILAPEESTHSHQGRLVLHGEAIGSEVSGCHENGHGTQHRLLHCSLVVSVLVLPNWTHWPPLQWDISVFSRAWQETVFSESGKILV